MLNSPLHTYLLAEAFGLYFIIMSIILLSRENYYRKLMTKESHYPSFLSCSLSLFVSIILVLIHNFWVWQPRLLVTLVCWAYLLRNVLLIAYPERFLAFIRRICMSKTYYLMLLGMAILGTILLVRGSMLFVAFVRT